MPAKANPRNHRNNPYVFDGLLANAHQSAAGVWTIPGILEALIPGRMQSHACTAEVPR
jgi:hypothetical protein